MRQLNALPLAAAEIDRAFALIQLDAPEIDLLAWRRHVAGLERDEAHGGAAGALAVKGEQGYFCGLGLWRRRVSLRRGAVLTADHLVVLDLIDPQAVADALIRGLERVAATLCCRGIELALPRGETRLIDRLRGSGHDIEGVILCKPLSTA